jgi:DNA-binding FadR family transcriptional regulator
MIVDEIKRWIVVKRLQPNDRLPQESVLMDLLESSRGTVREALKVLESQGLIQIIPGVGGGARVASVSYEKASSALRSHLYFQPLSWSQVYRLRRQVEPILAADVVEILTADDLAALRETVETCRLGIADEVDPREHRIAELEFHAILARACNDPMMRFLCSFITDLLRDLTFTDPRNILEPKDTRFAKRVLHFHTELIAAYEARDQSKVQQLMTDHICDAGDIVSEREALLDHTVFLAPGTGAEWRSRSSTDDPRLDDYLQKLAGK